MLGGLSMSGLPINAQPYAGGHRFINSPQFTNANDFNSWLADTKATAGGLLSAGQNYVNPMGQAPSNPDQWGVNTHGGMVPGIMDMPGVQGGLMDAPMDYSDQLGENWVQKLMTPVHQEAVKEWYNAVNDYGTPPEGAYVEPNQYTPPAAPPAPVEQAAPVNPWNGKMFVYEDPMKGSKNSQKLMSYDMLPGWMQAQADNAQDGDWDTLFARFGYKPA